MAKQRFKLEHFDSQGEDMKYAASVGDAKRDSEPLWDNAPQDDALWQLIIDTTSRRLSCRQFPNPEWVDLPTVQLP